ncbi:Mediator of RNA polymerase II transcription subunit 17 [Acorus calamus]|uniref:Mediator of RNA polymerase II transcription subunit 17 n=1 Tax=Acorus calamus TaxID=4465 RepID=A0AAV9DDD4_ACOCL|nr:Mediator of RNA polymerase II transcription subunit 17 [Acorus calamus]
MKMEIDLDKLPIKRLDAIEENGIEHFPPDVGQDEKRLDLIRRIDFTPIVEREAKKAKGEVVEEEKKSSAAAAVTPTLPWQSLMENLQLAHQELSVVIDLINTVETNDAVTVAGMTRPKQLPNEVLADLSVSAATKLQHFRHLGKYFKQSSKALEQQTMREARFYGALIRLQQNWKVKRQRAAVSGPGNEGFTIDLFDNSLADAAAMTQLPALSTVRVDHDTNGMLTVKIPPKSCHSIQFGFHDDYPSGKVRNPSKEKMQGSVQHPLREAKKEAMTDEDVNECVKEVHSVLCRIHQSIFQEQLFDLVNCETFSQTQGVNVTCMRENFLQLSFGDVASVFLRLVPSEEENSNQTVETLGWAQDVEDKVTSSDKLGLVIFEEKHNDSKRNLLGLPNPVSFSIYLQQIFHENLFVKGKERRSSVVRPQVSSHSSSEGIGLLGHFCMTLAHRIFSNKVQSELENLVSRIPYVNLLSHPTWHSRSSSWSLSMKIPQSVLRAGRRCRPLEIHEFHTKVVVNDECISVSGDGAPNVIGSFRDSSDDACTTNSYGCEVADLPVILLQQVASQVLHWLHEEALIVGMKVRRDFLHLSFELDHGETLGLAAHVDPEDDIGCISWWLVMEDSFEEAQLHKDLSNGVFKDRKFLGYLSLDSLYTVLMDLVGLCNSG